MSPESVLLHARPSLALLAEGTLGDAIARLCERRERASFERGERAGRADAMAQAVTQLDRVVAELNAAGEAANSALTSDSVELALAIATELVRCEVGARRHGIEKIVRETLMASGVGRGACKVHVAPDDAELLSKLAFRAGTEIEADLDVGLGCVQVQTPQGLLVRDIDAALASIAARLREEAQS